MKGRACKFCGAKVDVQVLDGIVMMYDQETRQPHNCGAPSQTMTADGDRCPVCGERGDMSMHICKR